MSSPAPYMDRRYYVNAGGARVYQDHYTDPSQPEQWYMGASYGAGPSSSGTWVYAEQDAQRGTYAPNGMWVGAPTGNVDGSFRRQSVSDPAKTTFVVGVVAFAIGYFVGRR